ncbi:MAG: hypothetical protein IKI88_07540 [Anaerotignum sp.]|nr:hypothetical protein [Anaerotignum sp.]
MQNPHVKYLKTKNGYFYLFYYEQGNIFCRCYAANGWTAPQRIAEKTFPVFSLCQYQDTVYLLYSGDGGQLYLASSVDFSQWEHRPMMTGTHHTGQTKFFILPTEDAFHVVYHLPTESTGVDSLVYTSFREGQWEKPYQIDRFLPMHQTPFFARRLSREHVIFYYRTGRNVISAREMLLTPYTMGSVTPLIQTPSPCIDVSIVNDSEKIHMLYIVRSLFRTQVVYQYKHTAAISTPRILWEDGNCDNCVIYLENGNVVAMWTVNGQPMRCISQNGGSNFGPAERYTNPFPAYCTKGELLGAEDMALNSTELYGDAQHGFLPALFPLAAQPAPAKEEPRQNPLPDYEKAFASLQESHKQQMEELSLLLAQRSDEISTVNARWKAQMEQMENQMAALRRENEQLKTNQSNISPALPSETEE